MTIAEQKRLDELSRPLRKTLGEWARQFGWGCCGGWSDQRGMWRYEVLGGPRKLFVEVLEDGSAALAWSDPTKVKNKATTPRGLRRVLDQICEMETPRAAPEQVCNRRACRAPNALWWNSSTLAYYCFDCAMRINETNPGLCIKLTPRSERPREP